MIDRRRDLEEYERLLEERKHALRIQCPNLHFTHIATGGEQKETIVEI